METPDLHLPTSEAEHEVAERPAAVGYWGNWSFRVEVAKSWGFGLFRVGWLGVTTVVLGRIVLVINNPIWF